MEPMRALSKEEMENMNLRYYNPEIHKASFVLPEFAKKVNVSFFECNSKLLTHICYFSLSIFLTIDRYSMKHDQKQTTMFNL